MKTLRKVTLNGVKACIVSNKEINSLVSRLEIGQD